MRTGRSRGTALCTVETWLKGADKRQSSCDRLFNASRTMLFNIHGAEMGSGYLKGIKYSGMYASGSEAIKFLCTGKSDSQFFVRPRSPLAEQQETSSPLVRSDLFYSRKRKNTYGTGCVPPYEHGRKLYIRKMDWLPQLPGVSMEK